MKKLSVRQARNCENAIGDICKCRCGGVLHGSGRAKETTNYTDFSKLPAEDPHYIAKKQRGKKVNYRFLI